ncbi:MAG: hypothetical protein P4L35_07240 [Ignavibacteriaceae bacterium]|nr:hypothetical protein [Ignavibacteriaceae bacterium]
MIPEIRKVFNAKFSVTSYQNYINELNTALEYPVDFRVSETPVFLTDDLTNKLVEASNDILSQLLTPEYKKHSLLAIPEGWNIPGEPEHPEFLQIDFGITKTDNGTFIPKLIELQAFPTIYGYQYFQNRIIRKHFDINEGFTPYFSNFNEDSYVFTLKEIILNNHSPENVILLDIQPEKQKTRIDFSATKKLIGIQSVCISKVFSRGNKLFYFRDNKETQIQRIYNRVIFDELMKSDIKPGFNIHDEFDVEWTGHPNWFYRISKFSLPFIKSKYAPKAFFLDEIYNTSTSESSPHSPGIINPDNYVLKPLFSFAGSGVDINPSKEKLDSIHDKHNYILQEKIEYDPVILTPDGNSKFEIRMMYLWKDKPLLVNNLVRMSKGKMMGVDYNKNKTWVGSTLALHYPEVLI